VLAPALIGVVIALATTLPLAWKWQLGLRRVGIATVLLGVCSGAVVTVLAEAVSLGLAVSAFLTWMLTMGAATAVLAWRFYRDPERTPPPGDGLVVSPADGEIVYVRRSDQGRLPVVTKRGHDHTLEELVRTDLKKIDAHVIGIAMSFLDVHINRAPIDGTVTLRKHFPGMFGSLRDPEMVFRNERATTLIERDSVQVAVVQIASRLVRQIVAFVNEGERVTIGQRIGVIRLGSQVDVVLPASENIEVSVKPGDHVRAGESVLARLR
jgi:phosphatidylserine decarboxylase